jgi:hypothetical protein
MTQPSTGRGWGVVFLLAGLPAVFSAMVLPFNPGLALPWVIVFWPLTVFAGYRIWRARNPTMSARTAIATRARMVADIIAGTIDRLG